MFACIKIIFLFLIKMKLKRILVLQFCFLFVSNFAVKSTATPSICVNKNYKKILPKCFCLLVMRVYLLLFIRYICINNHTYVSLGSKGLYLVDSVCDRSNAEYYWFVIKKSFNIYVNKRKHMTLSGSKYGLFSCLCLLLFIDANLNS